MKKYKIVNHLTKRIGRIHFSGNDTSTPSPVDIKRLVRAFTKHFKKYKKPNYIAAAGYSGCAIGTVISTTFSIPLILLRNGHPYRNDIKIDKKFKMITREISINNGTHDFPTNGTYIFVDDLIDSGITFARVFTHLQKNKLRCVGVGFTDTWMRKSAINYCFSSKTGEYPDFPIIKGRSQ